MMENKMNKEKRDVTMSNITSDDRDSVGQQHQRRGCECTPRGLSHSTNSYKIHPCYKNQRAPETPPRRSRRQTFCICITGRGLHRSGAEAA